MARATRVVIDLDALEHNVQQVKRFAANAKVMAVVKADAYGHGVSQVATHLAKWCDSFAVATVEEAVAVRQVVSAHPVVVLSAFQYRDELELARHHKLSIVVHDSAQIDLLNTCAHELSVQQPLCVWIKANTGMNRTGFVADHFDSVVRSMLRLDGVQIQGAMTHFACADDTDNPLTKTQLDRFVALASKQCSVLCAANSAGVVSIPESHLDVVRPGIMLYGVSPLLDKSAKDLSLRPVMRFESTLIAIQTLQAGDSIGYGQTYRLQQPGTIGLVGCGYGDGYPRLVKDATPVQINNTIVPKVGRVSMDSFAVDLTRMSDVAVGDRVVMWGDQVPVEQVAQSAGTIAYETLCQVTQRVPRIYQSSRPIDFAPAHDIDKL